MFRSLCIGAVASTVDYSVLSLLGLVLGVPAAFASFAALSVGTTVNFALNRRYSFRDNQSGLAGAAARYAAAFGCLMVLHSASVGMLTDRLAVPLLLSKLVSDVTLLLGGQLLLLRYVVFPRNKRRPSPAVAGRAAESA